MSPFSCHLIDRYSMLVMFKVKLYLNVQILKCRFLVWTCTEYISCEAQMCYKKGKSSATLQQMVHLLPLKRSCALLSSFPLLNEMVTSETSEDLIMHWRNACLHLKTQAFSLF